MNYNYISGFPKISHKLRGYHKALEQIGAEIGQESRRVMIQPQHWSGFEGRLTRRKNKTIAYGSFRNIVDTGNLMNSQKVTVYQDNNETRVTVSYDSEYYDYVRYGTRLVPARDWVTIAKNKVLRGKSLPIRVSELNRLST